MPVNERILDLHVLHYLVYGRGHKDVIQLNIEVYHSGAQTDKLDFSEENSIV